VSAFWQFLLLGLALCPSYALTAQGIVLVYRGSGVVNFASGSFALVGAYLDYVAQQAGVAPVPALVLGVLAGAVVGALTYAVVMRYLANAPQVTRTIATLGIQLTAVQVFALIYSTNVYFPKTIFQDVNFHVLGANVSKYNLILFGFTVALTAGLWAAYKWTKFGLQTSAVAENRRAAAALGHSPERVGVLNWTFGGALSALAGILIAPIIGLSVSTIPLLLLPALAAALLGSFTSFGLTLLGAMIIAIGESELQHYNLGTGWDTAFPFLVVIAVLVLRSSALPERSVSAARLPAIGLGLIRARVVLPAIAATCLVAAFLPADGAGALTVTFATAIIGLSMLVVTGYAGQISLAQLGLAGVGAFASSRLAASVGMSFWEVVPLAILIALPIGAVVGLPALRTRGVNLAIATLGFAVVIQEVVLSNTNYTGGSIGTAVTPPSLFGYSLDNTFHTNRYAILCFIFFAVCCVLVANLRRGRVGRQLIAVRANERASATLGINVTWAKLYAFIVAAGLAALGGVLLAFRTTYVLFQGYDPTTGIALLSLMIVGGIGYIGGSAFLGWLAPSAFGVWIISLISNTPTVNDWVALLSGVAVVATVMFYPDGVAAWQAADWKKRFGRFLGPEPAAGIPDEPDREPPRALRAQEHRLEVESLGVRFGGVVAVNDVSLVVRSGEILGLIGPNGAGKTTMIDAITGLNRRYSGHVSFDGQRIDRLSPAARARLGIGRSYQSLELFEDLSVEDNLRVGADAPTAASYLTDLVRPGKRPLSPAAIAAIREFELEGDVGRKPGELPFGRRRLVGIARAIATNPSVLLLDEPSSGLDEGESKELAALLRRLTAEWNIAILLVDHDMSVVMSVSNEIIALDFGRAIASGPPEQVRNDPAVISAYLGGDDEKPVASEREIGANP
jgi:sulfate-transporting ATPase